MLVLYSGMGASGFDILGQAIDDSEWIKLLRNVCQLLKAQNKEYAASILESNQFKLSEGTNRFGDEFSVLHAPVSVEAYIEFTKLNSEREASVAFKEVSLAFKELGIHVRFIAVYISNEKVMLVPQPSPKATTAIVERALKDSQQLLYTSGAASAVDRVHTALHGFLKEICIDKSIQYNQQASLTEMFKIIRTQHPALTNMSVAQEETKKLLGALSSIIDTLNTLRNNASVAHPNDNILEEAEAVLAINCARTMLHYLDAKTK